MTDLSTTYKSKPDKHKYRRRNKTLDEVHHDHIREFDRNQDKIPRLTSRLDEMQTELDELESLITNNRDDEVTNRKAELRENIKKLNDELGTYQNFENQMEYFGRVGDVLFEYYDTTSGAFYNHDYEEANNNDEPQVVGIQISENLSKLSSANRQKRKKQPKKRPTARSVPQSKGIMALLFGDEPQSQQKVVDTKCRARLEDQYLSIVDKDYSNGLSNIPITKCPECNSDRIVFHTESLLICPNPDCSIAEEIMIEADVPSQRENYNEKTKYPYKRIAHFVEKLNQFLCKGASNVPPHVYQAIDVEMRKYSYTANDVTIKFLERSLKRHSLSNFYEYSMYIYCKIKKIEPLTITRDEYDLMIKMFQMMNEVYEEHYKPDGRSNFLRYTVAMYRIFLLLGKKEHANSLKLLKDVDKMNEQFRIIDKIFDHLGWEYDSTAHNISQISGGASRIVNSKSKQNYQAKQGHHDSPESPEPIKHKKLKRVRRKKITSDSGSAEQEDRIGEGYDEIRDTVEKSQT